MTETSTYEVDLTTTSIYDDLYYSTYLTEDITAPELVGLSLTATSIDVSVTGTGDSTAPELVNLSLTSSSVEASSGEGRIGTQIQISDDSSGFDYGSIYFSSPSGNSYSTYISFSDPSNVVGGTELAGTYASATLLSELAEAGTWTVNSISLRDDAGNSRYYSASDLQTLGIDPANLSFEVTNNSTGGGDSTAPELVNLSLTSSSVEASSGEGRIGTQIQISDDSSGFDYGSIYFSSPSGNSYSTYISFSDPSNLVSGTELAGTYASATLLSELAEAGTWTVNSISLRDDAGNSRYYSASDLQTLGIDPANLSFEVTNNSTGGGDSTAPELVNLSLTSSSVEASSGEGRIGTQIQISDDSSGFDYGSIYFSSPSGNSYSTYISFSDPSNLVSGTELAGTYASATLLSELAEAGTWTVNSISLRDDAGNSRYYSASDLQTLGIDPANLSFEVTQNGTGSSGGSDGTAPELVNLSLTSSSVEASSGEGRIGAQIQISDDSSGFSSGSIFFRSPSGATEGFLLYDPDHLISGTELAGTYASATLLSEFAEAGTWTVNSISLEDDTGNSRYYFASDLQTLGIDPANLSFEVTNANSDGTAPELVNLSLTSSSIEASSGEGRIGAQIQISDDSSGFDSGYISFRSPSGATEGFLLYDPDHLISGTELAGTYASATLLSEFAEAGTWTVNSISLEDDTGNSRYYFASDLQTLGIDPANLSFEVTNANSDGTAPELVNLSLTSSSVEASSGEGRIGAQIQISDDSSGFDSGYISFRSPSGATEGFLLYDPDHLISGTELAGTYASATLLSEFAEAGTWTVNSISLEDDTGNSRYYFASDLQTLGIDPANLSFEVTQNGTSPGDSANVTVAVSPSSVTEDGTTNLVYTFTRTGDTTNPLTVNYSIAGTADSADYTGATPGTGQAITFEAGYSTATLTIDPTADTTIESNETVSFTLADGSGYTIGTPTAVTGTIANDDTNILLGTPQNDTLDASTGQYTVISLAGDDTILVNIASDVIIELPNEGTDTIVSSVNYNLAAHRHIENLTLTGTDDITGIGNRRDNIITGNRGQNVLVGLQGDDTFVFNFGDSSVAKPDRIRDFEIGHDRLLAGGRELDPQTLTSASDSSATTLEGVANSVFTDFNRALSGNQALGINSAALVVATARGISGTYVVVNDGLAGFNAESDLVIKISDLSSIF